jgi:hypothetical protein
MQGRRLETTGGVAFSATRPELPRQLLPVGNTLRIVSGRERRRWPQIVCRSRMALLGQTLGEEGTEDGLGAKRAGKA